MTDRLKTAEERLSKLRSLERMVGGRSLSVARTRLRQLQKSIDLQLASIAKLKTQLAASSIQTGAARYVKPGRSENATKRN